MLHKSLTKSLLAGVFALAASAAFAQTASNPQHLVVGVYPAKQVNKIHLVIEKQPDAFVSVQMLAATGEELYHAHLPRKGDRFNQVFDMNQLIDGTYTLRIKQGKDIIVKQIQLQTATPEPVAPIRLVTLGE